MAMELSQCATQLGRKHHKRAITATIPIKSFMYDMTIFLKDVNEMQQAINKVNEFLQWAKMKVKPAKSRSLKLSRHKVDPTVIFTISNNNIPTVCDGPVKSLGRWFASSLKATS